MYIEALRFSLWADFIEREYLDGAFSELIKRGLINGATSNPAIFKNAILTSNAYKEQLLTLGTLTPKEKYEALAIFDIKKAAQILRALYEKGDDGFVSIEVDPFLCDDAEATIAEGKRLFSSIGEPNVMIKVPATEAGYVAMEELLACGIAVNATLIFSKEQALACAGAFARAQKRSNKVVQSVISVFVSRIDRALDATLATHGIAQGLSGIYNSAAIYSAIESLGLSGCRTLFASTGVKGDAYPAHYYIEKLLAYNSVNTAPIETIEAYCKNGAKEAALPLAPEIIEAHFIALKNAGVDFDALLSAQIKEGLEAFKVAFKDILEAL